MKPALSFVSTVSLLEALPPLDAGLERLIGGGDRADHLEQLHHLHRVEEVEADEALGPLRRGALRDHGQRGGVGGEDRAVLDDPVDLAPHRELLVEVLGDRLDDEVAVGEVGVVERPLDAPADLVRGGLLELALLDRAAELLLDLPEPLVERALVDLADDHVIARLRRGLCDSVAHEAAADDPHLLDVH